MFALWGGTSWLVLVGDTELLRFSSRKRNTGSKKKWRGRLPQCGPGLRGWKLKLGTQDGLVMRKYLYRSYCLFHHVAIPSIGIAVYDLQRAAAGKRLQHRLHWAWHHWGREWEPWRRQRSGETLGYRHRSMKRCKWKVSFLMDNGMDQWCFVLDVFMKCEYCKLKASLLMASWTEQCLMCLMLSWNGNIANPKLIWWPAELSLVLRSVGLDASIGRWPLQPNVGFLGKYEILGSWCDHWMGRVEQAQSEHRREHYWAW